MARYRTVELLSDSPGAQVWRGWDDRLGRPVVLRVGADAAPATIARFARAAHRLAPLDHPAIVGVQDLDVVADGRPCLVQRQATGATFHARLLAATQLRDPAALRALVEALQRAAEAVGSAHARGLPHGDLSPSNILVGRDGDVAVIDWGLDTPNPRGTPGYEAPERAAGAPPDAASDVWSLGALLLAVAEAAPAGRWRDEVRVIGLEATDADPVVRPVDARAFAYELRVTLDGSRRREQALALVREADDLATDEEEARTRWLAALHQSLRLDPELPEAHARLARHWRALHAEAERIGAPTAAWEALLREHDRGEHADYLDGTSTVTLLTSPPGAQVALRPLREVEGRLVPGAPIPLGATPLVAVPAPHGPALLDLSARAEACRLAVRLPRAGRWPTAPGDPVRLSPDGPISPDDCHVPAGPALIGSTDPAVRASVPQREVWVDAFVIRRHPVTNAEYLAWLDALPAAEAERHFPRAPGADGRPGPAFVARGEDGRHRLVPDSEGHVWAADWPVVMVDVEDAEAYAGWLAAGTGQPWRLPREEEWEKAARGGDGRRWPWGNGFDRRYANTRGSRAEGPGLAAVTEFPLDESPYGVRGLAGNVIEWGATELEGAATGPRRRICKGGCWSFLAEDCRTEVRWQILPVARRFDLGFRLARDTARLP